ncbi:sterol-binding protein [Streptomyces physcomitrii]|uniref:Sterol-binding protein n=1 Tax=Streptomyces physcomitrii TaxID=2724184 RepID=A0ABX1HAV2_9ACTN|nr:sterol-binding protein [Streptomyces physcomitrii]NKI45534.1 sterol-binding protein [Streptomyces physcomitrii]
MATVEQCRAALGRLSERMGRAEGEVRRAAALDRSLSCHLTDHDVTFTGRLHEGRIDGLRLHEGPPTAPKAQIRLAMTGEDLVALVDGELHFARAWGSGRVRLEAGLRDLLRLRRLL